jgi:4-amino-4-deoxy-L-arabinose transferase-like glycosyltransferase
MEGASLVRLFETKPERFLVFVLIAQALLWTVIPALCYANAPLDVIENISWGHEWRQMGFYKHPPLQAWLTQAAWVGGGGRVWMIYLFSQAAIVLTQWALFTLGRDVAGAKAGLWAVLLFSLVYYANLPSPEFNTNVVQMPIWAWAAVALHRAINRRGPLWWLLLALTLALALYAKYSVVILIGTLAAALFSQSKGRASLRTPWPWLAGVLALALVMPQLLWLRGVNFLPLTYTADLNGGLGLLDRLVSVAGFLGGQILDHLAMILLLVVAGAGLFRRAPETEPAFESEAQDRRFVAVLAVAPYALSILMCLFGGVTLRDMWGAPMAVWISLAAVLYLKPALRPRRLRWALGAWLVLFVALPAGTGAASILGATRAKPPKIALPGAKLAQSLTDIWYDQTGAKLDLVAGDTWPAGVVVAYSRDHPSVFVDGNLRYNPWVTPQRLAQSGVLVVWTGSDAPPRNLQALGPFQSRGHVAAKYRYGGKLATFSWAIHAPPPRGAGPKP